MTKNNTTTEIWIAKKDFFIVEDGVQGDGYKYKISEEDWHPIYSEPLYDPRLYENESIKKGDEIPAELYNLQFDDVYMEKINVSHQPTFFANFELFITINKKTRIVLHNHIEENLLKNPKYNINDYEEIKRFYQGEQIPNEYIQDTVNKLKYAVKKTYFPQKTIKVYFAREDMHFTVDNKNENYIYKRFEDEIQEDPKWDPKLYKPIIHKYKAAAIQKQYIPKNHKKDTFLLNNVFKPIFIPENELNKWHPAKFINEYRNKSGKKTN